VDEKSASSKWVDSQRRPFKTRINYWSTRWRSLSIRLLERVLIGNSLANVVIQDFSSLQHYAPAKNSILQIKKIESGSVEVRPVEFTTGFAYSYEDARRPIFGYLIANPVIHVESGLVNACGGFLVEELAGHYMGIFGAGTVAHEYALTNKNDKKLKGTWASAGIPKQYFHFLAQVLPTLIRTVETFDVEGIVLSKSAPRWAIEALSNVHSNLLISDEATLELERMALVSVPQVINSKDIDLMKKFFSASIEDNDLRKLAFATRAGNFRELKFEGEIAKFVQEVEGITVVPESLNFIDEINFFSTYTHYVITGGSATANCIWMKPGTKVLIVFSGYNYETQFDLHLYQSNKLDISYLNIEGLLTFSEVEAELRKFTQS
jgi:hypothetical protein